MKRLPVPHRRHLEIMRSIRTRRGRDEGIISTRRTRPGDNKQLKDEIKTRSGRAEEITTDLVYLILIIGRDEENASTKQRRTGDDT